MPLTDFELGFELGALCMAFGVLFWGVVFRWKERRQSRREEDGRL